jgi:hypothetical protein
LKHLQRSARTPCGVASRSGRHIKIAAVPRPNGRLRPNAPIGADAADNRVSSARPGPDSTEVVAIEKVDIAFLSDFDE